MFIRKVHIPRITSPQKYEMYFARGGWDLGADRETWRSSFHGFQSYCYGKARAVLSPVPEREGDWVGLKDQEGA